MCENMNDNHGGNVYKICRQYGRSVDEVLDFSANLNPLGIPKSLKELIISNLDVIQSYPDIEYHDLRNNIASYLNVDYGSIIVGNGAAEIIYLLMGVIKPGKILIPVPTFSEYEKSAQSQGVPVEYFILKEDENFMINVEELMDKLKKGIDALIICNPNNPTSNLIEKKNLEKIIRYAYKKNVIVIIDEAFIELTVHGNNNSVVDLIAKYDNLFIIRAFTKIFSIPGLRLGYGVGNKKLIKKMWNSKLPWSVNSISCLVGSIISEEEEYFEKTSNWLKNERERFYSELSKIEKLKVFYPSSNFILIKILDEGMDSKRLTSMMRKKGILIRDASNFRFLDNKFFRVAIKDRENNARLVKELQSCILEGENKWER